MKLYRTPTGHWAGNQDDARSLAKQYNTEWESCEVPESKIALLAFLNEHKVGATPVRSEAHKDTEFLMVRSPVFVKPTEVTRSAHEKLWDRMELEDAILKAPLDTAVALAELVMSRIRDFTRGK